MSAPTESKTLTVTINRSADDVYEFVRTPENLPKWAKAFCRSAFRVGQNWMVQTATGDVGIRFAEQNKFRVCDHFVTPAPGMEVYVPMRVLQNGGGAEVLLTLFRQFEMTDEDFERDLAMVERDLETLKALMQRKV